MALSNRFGLALCLLQPALTREVVLADGLPDHLLGLADHFAQRTAGRRLRRLGIAHMISIRYRHRPFLATDGDADGRRDVGKRALPSRCGTAAQGVKSCSYRPSAQCKRSREVPRDWRTSGIRPVKAADPTHADDTLQPPTSELPPTLM